MANLQVHFMKPELNGAVDVSSSVAERQRHGRTTSNNWNKLSTSTLSLEELQWYHLPTCQVAATGTRKT